MFDDDARHRLWQVLHSIPAGRVTSYGRVAELAGLPRAARWVGRTLAQLPADSTLPWHRVVNASGRLSLPIDSAGYQEQRRRLLEEGIEFRGERIDWRRFGWP